MNRSVSLLFLGLMVLSPAVKGYEYPLQFTPNAGYQGLVLAGYSFSGNTVLGNCSYFTTHSGSGKGGGYRTSTTYYNQTCSWDLSGNLLSITPGAPAIPAPLSMTSTQTVYALNASGDSTGTDTKLPYRGFVNTPGSHYSWLTSSAYTVLQQTPYTFPVTLSSNGDVPLNISSVGVSALFGRTLVNSTSCIGQIAVGMTCTITVTYDATKLRSPSGLAYDTLDISVISDAGQANDFRQSYTVVVTRSTDDDN
jgi:hypothetical protein